MRLVLSLVSHTNAGKTTLARTLLWREVGDVRDAPHVTEFAEGHTLVDSPEGDTLELWDTPGFGDSARLVQRLRGRENALGWFLSQVWDRWRDRPFWASQQALQHVRDRSDAVLYLVNASEPPAAAGYLASEMELLGWLGKPVLVLLNQLGAPRDGAEEGAEVEAWQQRMQSWPLVRGVLPLDAFARCWVQELTLWRAVEAVFDGDQRAAMARLRAAWSTQREATFEAAADALAASLARIAAAREAEPAGAAGAGGWRDRVRQFDPRPAARDARAAPGAAERALAAALTAEVRQSTAALIALHGLSGHAEAEILSRLAGDLKVRRKVDEGASALVGGAASGALLGLKADIATGGLTLGGGVLAGTLLGALGAAGLARAVNVWRDTDRSWVAWGADALQLQVQAALLRYLAVAHFGRGRGDWQAGEAPAHWRADVQAALAPHEPALLELWRSRSRGFDNAGEAAALQAALRPVVLQALRATLQRLYGEHAAA